jgi:glycerol kinase
VPYCDKLKEEGYEEMINRKTGLLIDTYFSASKLHWMMMNIRGLKERAKRGGLLLGTMDSWLLWKLTAGRVHATDYSNACRTMLFNIHTLQWDNELIELFGLHRSMFPEPRFSDEIFGHTEPGVLFDEPLPIAGIMGDSHAALFGQLCTEPGLGKATYGTGSSVMMNTGLKPMNPPDGLVTSIGFGMNREIHYVFEGNIHATGDTINWLKNELQLIDSASETEELATGTDGNHGVYLVPAFVGLGAPYWDSKARASITGMSRDTTKAHVVRAALESIAYQIRDLTDLMEGEGNVQLQELRVDGGPTRNRFLMQFQADMLKRKVICSEIEEVSALGASFMAGLATSFWKSMEEIASLKENARVFEPSMDETEADRLYGGWKKAVQRTRL